jgi:hypothetical protein
MTPTIGGKNEAEAAVEEFRAELIDADVEWVGKETEEERKAREERRAALPRLQNDEDE